MLTSIRIRNSKQLPEKINDEHVSLSRELFWNVLEGISRQRLQKIQSIHYRQERHMSQAQRIEANTVGIQATEAHQDQILHLIEEQRDFLQAANRFGS